MYEVRAGDEASPDHPPLREVDDVQASRRRLLRGGLAAAPVMMTLVSRPVIAGGASGTGGACTTASTVSSVTASGAAARLQSCAGRSPEFWVGSRQWPPGTAPAGEKATMFTGVFGGSVYQGKTMYEVMASSRSSSGQDGLARYLSAAYLNALAGTVPNKVLSPSTAKNIWTTVVVNRKGWYEPTAGVKWYADHAEPAANQPAGIIAWIRTTMT